LSLYCLFYFWGFGEHEVKTFTRTAFVFTSIVLLFLEWKGKRVHRFVAKFLLKEEDWKGVLKIEDDVC